MKRFAPHIASLSLLIIFSSGFIVPMFVHAQSLNLIVCDPTVKGHECGFGDLMILVKNIINDLILLSSVLVTIALAAVGIMLLTKGENANAMKELKGTAWTIIKGYLWILSAWLIVYTITSTFLNSGFSVLGAP